MDSTELIESFAEFANQKKIDRPTVMKILDEVFRTLIKKKFDTDENFDVIINVDKGDLEIWRYREIVADNAPDFDEISQIKLSDARKIEPDFEVGEECAEELKINDFGRRLVIMARQTLMQKIKDLERESIYEKYKDLVGEIVSAEVYQVWSREVLMIDGEDNELVLPKNEQINKDRFRKGDIVRAIVSKVELNNGNPRIILSRTSPKFLERLFETEVPEVYDGLIQIKKVVREPGERAKVAVDSYDDRIDPVGACVGMKGSRIHSIVRELNNENIDVINYTENIELYVARALSPAKISSMKINEDKKSIEVFLQPDQVSLAIGRGGQNIRLASKLVGYEIDVYREGNEYEEDIEIEEFSDELESWIIEELKRVGLDTARSILTLSVDDLVRRTDLEEETVAHVLQVLQTEFEEEK
jgi:transcription termination/antitermination protein NusA